MKYMLPIVLLLALAGCAKSSDEPQTRNVFAMDTEMTLKAYGRNADKALKDAEAEIIKLDAQLRRGSEDSEIYAVNAAKTAAVSDETAKIISDALEICAETDGAFDITVAPVMDLWGFYTKEFHVPTDDELSDTLSRVDYRNVTVSGNTVSLSGDSQLDLGGIAKGYLSGRIMEIFKENGVESGIVSLGGNVQTLGKKPDGGEWRVAIQDPEADGYLGTLTVTDKAVITSGGYQRYFVEDGVTYHHIIDPSDGRSADSGVISVSVVSDNGELADGLSTALFVMGLDRGVEFWREHDGFDVIFMTDDGQVYVTEGLEDRFSSGYEYEIFSKAKLLKE